VWHLQSLIILTVWITVWRQQARGVIARLMPTGGGAGGGGGGDVDRGLVQGPAVGRAGHCWQAVTDPAASALRAAAAAGVPEQAVQAAGEQAWAVPLAVGGTREVCMCLDACTVAGPSQR